MTPEQREKPRAELRGRYGDFGAPWRSRRQEFLPGRRKERLGGRVAAAPDDHRRLLDLLRIVGTHDVHDIEKPEGCEAVLSLEAGAFALDSA